MQAGREVFLELGPGIDAVPVTGRMAFGACRVYVGIDAHHGEYCHGYFEPGADYGDMVADFWQEQLPELAKDRPGEHILFVKGRAQALPLGDAAVDEVYAANFLTSPLRTRDRRAILGEVTRVLKPGGLFTVKVGWDVPLFSEKEVSRWLVRAGFELAQIFTSWGDPEEFAMMLSLYGQSTLEADGRAAYYVLVQKPSS